MQRAGAQTSFPSRDNKVYLYLYLYCAYDNKIQTQDVASGCRHDCPPTDYLLAVRTMLHFLWCRHSKQQYMLGCPICDKTPVCDTSGYSVQGCQSTHLFPVVPSLHVHIHYTGHVHTNMQNLRWASLVWIVFSILVANIIKWNFAALFELWSPVSINGTL